VIYLAIFLVVAGGGIASLWLYQRRQRSHFQSVDGFRTSLERISTHEVVSPSSPAVRRPVSVRSTGRRRPEPLDPERREAARKRLERRRAARA
jgi:hypothetical protein